MIFFSPLNWPESVSAALNKNNLSRYSSRYLFQIFQSNAHAYTHTHTHWMCLLRNKGEVVQFISNHPFQQKKGRFLFISFHLSDYHLRGSIGVPKYLRLIHSEFHVLTADPIILFLYLKLWDECLLFFWKKSKLLIMIQKSLYNLATD